MRTRELSGYHRCGIHRSYAEQVQLENGKKNLAIYQKAAVMKELIREGLKKGLTEDAIRERLEEVFKEIPYPTEHTRLKYLTDACNQVLRYIRSENRDFEEAHSEVFNIFELEIDVNPDMVFRCEKPFEYKEKETYIDAAGKKRTRTVKYTVMETCLEVVSLKCKKPDVTVTGKGADTGMYQNLEMYCLLQYAKKEAEKDAAKGITYQHVGASMYFLRKDTDKSFSTYKDNFFEKGHNIVTMWSDDTVKVKPAGAPAKAKPVEMSLSAWFENQFQNFKKGEEIREHVCKDSRCEFYSSCFYNRPPKQLKENKKARHLKDITLTPEQEAVIYFRKGTARVNAGAGVGKTLMIALRTAYMLYEGIAPEKIILFTFTNSAAKEMRERIELYAKDLEVEADLSKLQIFTFNGFGNNLIAAHYRLFGFTEVPRLIDAVDRSCIIAEILNKIVIPGLDYRNFNLHTGYCMGAQKTAETAFSRIKYNQLSNTAADREELTNYLLKEILTTKEGFLTEEEICEYIRIALLIHEEFLCQVEKEKADRVYLIENILLLLLKRHGISLGDKLSHYLSFVTSMWKKIEMVRDEEGISDEKIIQERLKTAYEEEWITDKTLDKLFEAYEVYNQTLHQKNMIEYADQIMLVFDMLQKDPFFLEDMGIEHIMVDEFQDTDTIQLDILKNMKDSSVFQSFLVVGDDSQAIYSFRGGKPENIIRFFELIGNDGEDFKVLSNYRCSGNIIRFANEINRLNRNRVDKDLIPTRNSGEEVKIDAFWEKDEEDQAILKMIKYHLEKGDANESIAYLAYKRTQLLHMGTLLSEAGIPWVMLNPDPMAENSRVQAAIALARFYQDTDATRDAFIYLNARLKNVFLDMTAEMIAKTLTDFRTYILENLKRRPLENQKTILVELMKFLNNEEETDETFESFLEPIKNKRSLDEILTYCQAFELYGDEMTAKRDKTYPGVVLSTIHSAKGLEWPTVIISLNGFDEQGITGELFEERIRLLFVAATRARDNLYVYGQKKAWTKKGENGKKTIYFNRFLDEAYKIVTGKEFDKTLPEKE